MHSISHRFLLILIIISALSCANRGTVAGGEKDTTPPVIIRTVPKNFSTNFTSKEIRIYFDEYIKLKDLQKQLIISPPMNNEPTITPMGGASKYITIKINDTLLDNTTYALNFGQSIVDNNEDNPFAYYRYVFSTGTAIDSLSISGSITDALNQRPDTFVSVMLYPIDSSYTDSIVYKKKPKYLTNTLDSTTTFKIENIKAGQYKLIALKDENRNFTFEQKTDKIGFYEGEISVPADSVYNLKLFKEELDFKAFKPVQLGEQKIAFPYQGDYNSMTIKLLTDKPDDFKYIITKESKKDSLLYWYKPKFEVDTLLFAVKNKAYQDTLTHRLKSEEKDSLVIKAIQSGTLNFYENFSVEGSTPIINFDTTKIRIIKKDSSEVNFEVLKDSVLNRYYFPFEKEEDEKYAITLYPEAFTDFFDKTNDTINFKISTKLKANFGNIRVNLKNAELPLIVQLVNDKNEIKYEKYAADSPVVDFNDLQPNVYYLRVIYDTNLNGKYDTGSYLKKIQPERVSYLPESIEVRANFDFIIDFQLLN